MFSVVDVWEQECGACPFVWKPEIYKGDKADYAKGINKSHEEQEFGWNGRWKFVCTTFSTLEEAIKFADPDDTGYYYNFAEGGE